jgi:hypothetical protein
MEWWNKSVGNDLDVRHTARKRRAQNIALEVLLYI